MPATEGGILATVGTPKAAGKPAAAGTETVVMLATGETPKAFGKP
jgi:hypothetical protein